VLTAEAHPHVVDRRPDGHPRAWSDSRRVNWNEVLHLPASTYAAAIYCVTTRSKFAMTWLGMSVDTLLETARPQPGAARVRASPPGT
jgi:DMSO/TMAO reductase YedYZ molybdopterin-dependent catalytic subunit